MKIGIVGRGTVGNALARGLSRGHEIVSYDKYKTGFQDIVTVAQCPIIFFCVPTPMTDNGKIGLEYLEDAISKIFLKIKKFSGQIFVIKSTTIPGTTEYFKKKYLEVHWAFCPEFLNERSADEDFINTNRIIIGTESDEINLTLSTVFREANFTCPIHYTDSTTAEFVKYYCNILGATKVALANEMYQMAHLLGLDYTTVKKLVVTNKYFTDQHLDVPGPDGKYGFGGKCFSKDLNAFISFAKDKGYNPYFLEEIWRSNIKFRGEKE